MNWPLVSVIMPAYNVEKYIKYAIESVLCQTYRNIELLIIDDGSEDRTSEICYYYEQNDTRIHYEKQENSGAAAARNHGMRIAKGEYILFMDSDDSMHPQTIEILYDMIIENQVELSMIDFVEDDKPYINWKKVEKVPVQIFSQERMMDILCSGGEELKLRLLLTVPWGKLYHRNLLKKLYYPEGTICEDEFMINEIVFRCEKMVYMPVQMYGYLVRSGSVMHVTVDRRHLASLKAFEQRIHYAHKLELRNCEVKMIKTFMKDHIGTYCKACAVKSQDQEVFKWLKINFRKNMKKYWRVLDKEELVKSLIFYVSPKMYLLVKCFLLREIYYE